MKKQQKEIPKGYKETKLGLIPKDWEEINIGELFEFKNGLNKGKEFFGYGTPIINYMDVYSNAGLDKSNVKGLVSLNEKEILRFSARKGDVFFTRTSETQEEIGYAACLLEDIPSAVFSGFVLRARPINKKTNLHFRKYCFSSNTVRHEIKRKSSFTTRALTNGRFLSEVLLPLPPIPEQKKIAAILSTWDIAIEKTEQLIDKLKDRKKGLMQQLLTGKKRLPGFTEEWTEVKLGDITTERKTINTNNKILLSVGKDGVYPQSQSNKRNTSNADKSKYKLVMEDDICYNTMRMWQGRSALSENEGIVSPAYTVVMVNKNVDPLFLSQIIKLSFIVFKFWRNSQGLVSDTLNCKYKDFKKVTVKIPNKKEQKEISKFWQSMTNEIISHNNYHNEIIKQKKALMQQLLTGQLRVKI